MPTGNFDFLGVHDSRLEVLGGLAERRYLRSEPSTARFTSDSRLMAQEFSGSILGIN